MIMVGWKTGSFASTADRRASEANCRSMRTATAPSAKANSTQREREENLPLYFLFARDTAKQRSLVPSVLVFSVCASLLSYSFRLSISPIEPAAPLPYGYVPQRKKFASLSATFLLLIWPTARAGPLRSCAAPRPTSCAAAVPCGPCVQNARDFQDDYLPPILAAPKLHYPTVPLRAPRDYVPAVTRSMPET